MRSAHARTNVLLWLAIATLAWFVCVAIFGPLHVRA